MDETHINLHSDIKFECASMVVGWYEDAGQMGSGVIDFLRKQLKCRLLAEIEPPGFFPMNNIPIEDDVTIFPESKLYYCAEKDLLLFQSHSPNTKWYQFLNTLLDMAQFHCRLNEIYTMGGMISLHPHTRERETMVVVSDSSLKKNFQNLDVTLDMDYETPEGQRPTLNSFLMWIALQREIPATGLWIPVPFYLSDINDPQAWTRILEILNKRLELGLDFTDLDKMVAEQNTKIEQARDNTPELDHHFTRLENNESLSPEENDDMIKRIEDLLGTGD